MRNIIIIGSGPAGLSAAITARSRGQTVCVISNDASGSGLYKAPAVDNYPGLPGISGAELSAKLRDHALETGAEIITGRVTSALKTKSGVSVAYGNDMLAGKALILAPGVIQTSVFPGEAELLGRGVSYCATCDGMLYRGKKVVVLSLSPEAPEEAEYLRSIGCDVEELTPKNVVINGADKRESITADGRDIACDAVFVLR
ncbi:MAG: FAD-dependent oxidoreductase, partial [Clostridiales bacterium]|nr:FAD-dependent oxidoreductase [Clostridiales bacterium]